MREQKYVRKSGGIDVFIKRPFSEKVTLIESDSDFVLWFKVEKFVFGIDEDLYFGSVYVPFGEARFNTADEMSQK